MRVKKKKPAMANTTSGDQAAKVAGNKQVAAESKLMAMLRAHAGEEKEAGHGEHHVGRPGGQGGGQQVYVAQFGREQADSPIGDGDDETHSHTRRRAAISGYKREG